tara:strand:- start:2393 stop:2743 length:351 start_codon:yes stop_codon:yes gene_type:complete
MFYINKNHKKQELDFGFDDYTSRGSCYSKPKKKIQETITVLKQNKANFILLQEFLEVVFYCTNGELFNYEIYNNGLKINFDFIENEINKKQHEKIKNFLKKYRKENVFSNIKVLSI